MRTIGALLCGGAIMLLAAPALAQPAATPISGMVVTPPPALAAPSIRPAPHPLFRIGQLPAIVWAPVAPPYDTEADRNGAANPFWALP